MSYGVISVALAVLSLAAISGPSLAAERFAQTNAAGAVFRDCRDACPEMVVIPPGEYAMGSPATEAGRFDSEDPAHRVVIRYALAVGRYDITRGEYAAFVRATGYRPKDARCFTANLSGTAIRRTTGTNWRRPGFDQTARDPVVCVNFDDANAYVAWLSKKTGHAYRLLSEAEFEYAESAGTTSVYWWGDDATRACGYANVADLDAKASPAWRARYPDRTVTGCHDGYVFTSPVGRFKPNAFGLHDMTGDVWSWLADCWKDSYAGAPADGSANLASDCGRRSLRGGSWTYDSRIFRTANRDRLTSDARVVDIGFRIARTL
jgi:formylglycine-generating enzyme required for sulfatase activity